MLILLLAVCLGLLTIRFQRIFMEYAVNVCEDSAIKEINTLMEDEVFSHPDEFADLVVLERDSDNRITALRTDIIAVGKVKARLDIPGHGHGYRRHGARTVHLYRRLRL